MNNMNKKLKKEFDRQTGGEPLVNENDKKRFYEWVQGKHPKTRKSFGFPRLMTALLFLGFIAAIYTVFGSTNLTNLFEEKSVERSFEEYFYDFFADITDDEIPLLDIEVGILGEKDVIAVYKQPEDVTDQELTIGYFEFTKEDQWRPLHGRGINWKDPVIWSMPGNQPYLYTGVSDDPVKHVHVGSREAEVFSIGDGRYLWYATSRQTDEQATITMNGGNQKIIDEIPPPHELLAEKEGQYKSLVITESGGGSLPSKLRSASERLREVSIVPLSSARGSYPSLNIQNSPSFYFFNHEELVFESNDIDEALDFLEENDLFKEN